MKYKGIGIDDIVIYKHPLLYFQLSLLLILDLLTWFKKFVIKNSVYIIASAIFWGLVTNLTILNVSIILN